MRRRFLLFLALLGLSAVGATCKGQNEPSSSPPSTAELEEEPLVRAPAVTELEGVDITQVPPAYRADALRLLNESFCYCGCARTVASCLGNRAQCSCVECSERVANFILGAYANGATTGEVESQSLEAFSEAYAASPKAFDLENQPSLGPKDARHSLVEFADFRCPHCRTAFDSLVRFVQSRKDVRLTYYYFPLSSFGEPSLRAARAAEAARLQGKFWEMAALLYQNQSAFEDDDIVRYAQRLGLDMARFNEDLKRGEVHQAVMDDRSRGNAAGIQATPTIFVNGRPLGLPHTSEALGLRIAMEDDREACD